MCVAVFHFQLQIEPNVYFILCRFVDLYLTVCTMKIYCITYYKNVRLWTTTTAKHISSHTCPTQLVAFAHILKFIPAFYFGHWREQKKGKKSRKSIEFSRTNKLRPFFFASMGAHCCAVCTLVCIDLTLGDNIRFDECRRCCICTHKVQSHSQRCTYLQRPDAPHPFTETPYLFATHVSLRTLCIAHYCLSINSPCALNFSNRSECTPFYEHWMPCVTAELPQWLSCLLAKH